VSSNPNYDPEYQKGRSGRPVSRMRALVKREGSHICWLCSMPIDMDLPSTHAMSWTMDHVLPLSKYPSLALEITNIREAHRRCNSSKGNGTNNANGKISRNW
jgi:5-methylcytosine-specific restriction endonuclease McrA